MPVYHFKKISGTTSSGFDEMGFPVPLRSAKGADCAVIRAPQRGLLCYFNMDDTGSAAVDEVNGIALNIYGGMQNLDRGIKDRAWSAPAQGSYLAGMQEYFSLPGVFTLNAFCHPVMAVDNSPVIEFGSYDSNSGFGFFISGDLHISARINQDWNHYGAAVLPTDEWSMVTMTYDGTTVKSYVNGDLDSSRNFQQSPIDSGMINAFSRVPGGAPSADYWLGILDEAGLWNYAMSESQIQRIYKEFKRI